MCRPLVFFMVCVFVGFQIVHGTGILGEVAHRLKYITASDGKSFFADPEYRNWTDASNYCRSLGMELASITSRAQWTALDAAYSSDFDSYYHWTSGQDRLSPSQFIWQRPNSSLDESYINFLRIQSQPLQCVVFVSVNGTNTSFIANLPCTYRQPVICETNSS